MTPPPPDVMQQISELARSVVPGADEVSVTLLEHGQARTVAFTADLPLDLDARQYARGDGPCMHAAASGAVVEVADTSVESRWPDWAGEASEAGAGSLLSVALPGPGEVRAAMNLYSLRGHGFDDRSRTLATTLAAYAGAALAVAYRYQEQSRVVQQLQEAMTSRAVIDQARGILMAQRGCDADEAFAVLVDLSQRTNTKLRVLAQAVVDEAGQSR